MRRTRIIATLGPSCSNPEIITELINAGVDGFRINFSHGDEKARLDLVEAAREGISQSDREVPLIQDLTGPRIRTGSIEGKKEFLLTEGQSIEFAPGEDVTTEDRIGANFESLLGDIVVGDRILIDEGFIRLKTVEKNGNIFRCEVERGGTLGEHKGINLPDTDLNVPSLTRKDLNDLETGRKMEFDCIMQSFVRTPEDIVALHDIIDDWELTPQIIAKIETAEILDHLAEIARKVDIFLVARGDLGAEISLEDVPGIQKRIIRISHRHDVGVITATQMLESMINRPVPTRAEVSDISNAILDGTGAVMLSAETAIGNYPVETVREMHKVARKTDEDIFPYESSRFKIMPGWKPFIRASVRGGIKTAADVEADAIGVFTRTGLTACLVSQLRPRARILAFSDDPHIRRCLNIRWGIHSIKLKYPGGLEPLLEQAEKRGVEKGYLAPGDVIVFIAGTRKATGAENLVTIRKVGADLTRE